MPNDPTQQAPPVTPDPSQPDQSQSDLQQQQSTQWMAYHNSQIIGFFDNQGDATDALNGYQMDNNIDINDVLDVIQVTVPTTI